MIEVYYRYRVHASQAPAFEHAYGPSGPWAMLFAGKAGFRRTRLFRHRTEPTIYITIDTWESKDVYDRFRADHADEYARLDAHFRMLRLEEHLLGYYEGEDEYRSPVDMRA